MSQRRVSFMHGRASSAGRASSSSIGRASSSSIGRASSSSIGRASSSSIGRASSSSIGRASSSSAHTSRGSRRHIPGVTANTCHSYDDVKSWTKTFENRIGTGGTSIVYKGVYDLYDIPLAVKAYIKSKDNKTLWEAERYALHKFRHCENVVRCYGYAEGGDCYYILLEMLPNTVTDVVAELNWHKTLKILRGVASALLFIHDSLHVHGDIKLDNILIDEDFTPKICDFGFTVAVNDEVSGCTRQYAPPEFLKTKKPPANPASDIFCFGLVIQMLTIEEDPISKKSGMKEVPKNKKNNRREDTRKTTMKGRLQKTGFDDGSEAEIADLVLRCKAETIHMRPTIQEVVEILDSLQDKPFPQGQ